MTGALPTGEVTYLFTDIEGSTRLLERVGNRYGELLAAHHAVIRSAIGKHDGTELKTEGDAFFVVFPSANDAFAAAISAQEAIDSEPALSAEHVLVRMGLHTGTAVLGGDNYVGMDVHIAARVSAAAHGGQILVTDAVVTAGTVASGSGGAFTDIGAFWLKDIPDPIAIHQVTAPHLRSDFPPINAAATHPKNAPKDLSSFIGRDTETDTAVELLRSGRLVTLTGPGGTGKTRLGIEIGATATRMFRDGAVFVPLAGISDPAEVPNSLVDAVGASMNDPSVSPIEHLAHHLEHREMLLIVDNFEHVLDAAADVQTVLEASPGTKILATSRTPLGLRGERELAIAPLDVDTSAVQLFAERAQQVKTSFDIDSSNEDDIHEIVKRLDGLPLAIELAAARVRMMAPSAILATLDPLSLSHSKSTDARDLTLNDTIRWSFDLLDEPERQLMTRLAVFAAGGDLAQIEQVCTPSADLGIDLINGIGSLVEHSLLVADSTRGTPRFRMLETIHEFTRREFDSSEEMLEIRNRHTTAFVDLLETARPHLDGPESGEWMAVLAADNPNLQAAFAHAVDAGDAENAQRIVAAAWRFWQARGHLDEGTRAAEAALALDGSPAAVRAAALNAAGSIAYWCGDRPTTRRRYEQAVDAYRALDAPQGLASALYNLSFPVVDEDGLDAGTAMLEEAIALAETTGDRVIVGGAHAALARALFLTSPEVALDHGRKAVVESEALGNAAGTAWAYLVVGSALNLLDDSAAAVEAFQQALGKFVELNDVSGIAAQLGATAVVAHQVDEEATSMYLAGAVTRLWEETGLAGVTHLDGVLKGLITPEALASQPQDVAASFEAGRTADLETVIDAAFAWSVPAEPAVDPAVEP